MNRTILNVLVVTERIINVVTTNQKIKINKAIWQKLNILICRYRELGDL